MKTKKKDHNEYLLLDEGVWVRDYTLKEPPPIDQNLELFTSDDLTLCLNNETQNFKLRLPQISTERLSLDNIVIVSDGYGFTAKRDALMKLPKAVNIFATNDVLNQWVVSRQSRPITFYVVNNPYPECMRFLPRTSRYFPSCIASVRTHSEFLRKYIENSGVGYLYRPVANRYYSGLEHGITNYFVDDYRNSICAAISLAFRFNVRRLLVFCHDDCFEDARPGAVSAENNLWHYPQQEMSNKIIDAHLSWLKDKNIRVGYHATGSKLQNATYIPLEGILDFFTST